MNVDDEQALVDSLQAEVGDALRAVATYDEDGYDALYVRDDVADRLESRGDAVHEDLILRGLGRGHLEDLFGAGSLECSMHRFSDLTAFHFAAGEFTGLFVSVDSDTDVPLASFADRCKEWL
jgi:hypothetical protein